MTKQLALITGASSGIGAAYVDRLARRGYDLILVARDVPRMQAISTRAAEAGIVCEILEADLTHELGIAKVEARLAVGDVTLFINNAGMSLKGGLMDNGPTELTRIITLNVTAPTRLASAAAQAFAKRGTGAIINIASVLALLPEIFDGVYSGTKAFILNLSQNMAEHFKESDIYVQAVLPGATRTEIWERSGNDVNTLPSAMVMEVNDLVDAALVGFDSRESITIPPLHDLTQFTAMTNARLAMGLNLSTDSIAPRYR